MGWNPFKSKKKISVFSFATPVINDIPNLPEEAIATESFKPGKDRSLTQAAIEDIVNGVGRKIKPAYEYARDSYYYGLPNGHTELFDVNETDIKWAVKNDIGIDAVINNIELENADPEYGLYQILEGLNYDVATGEIDGPTKNVTTIGAIVGISPEAQAKRDALASDTETTEYLVDENNVPYHVKTRTVVEGSYDGDHDYNIEHLNHVTKWDEALDSGGAVKGYVLWRQYQRRGVQTHTYTITKKTTITRRKYNHDGDFLGLLEGSVSEESEDFQEFFQLSSTGVSYSTYFSLPAIYDAKDQYIIVQYVLGYRTGRWVYPLSSNRYPNLSATQGQESGAPFYPVIPIRRNNTDLFKDSYKGTRRYDTSLTLCEKMNVELLDIVDSVNENPDIGDIDHAYVMFGTPLSSEHRASKRYLWEFFDYYRTKEENNDKPITSLRIQDGGLDVRIHWSGISSKTVKERIGVVGTCELNHTTYREPIWEVPTNSDGAYLKDNVGNYLSPQIVGYKDPVHTLHLVKQISPTECVRLSVKNLTHTNYIYQGRSVVTNSDEVADTESHNFMVPLHFGVVEALPLKVKNELYYGSLNVVATGYQVTKVKWYQRSWFRAVLTLVGLYYGYVQFGQLGAAIGAAGGIATAAALKIIMRFVLDMYLKALVFKTVVRTVGADVAILIAIGALVANQFDFEIEIGEYLFDAESLMNLATNLGTGMQLAAQDEMGDLRSDIEKFEEEQKRSLDALEEANADLQTDGLVDAFTFIAIDPLRPVVESPDNYFNRTVHSGNVGALALDAVTHYTDVMLALPEPKHMY